MSIVSLSSYVTTKLKSIAGISPNAVFAYDNPQMSNFPFVTVTLKEWSGTILTNRQYKRVYIFTIRIYFEIGKSNAGMATVEGDLRTLGDLIIAAFDNDTRLGGNVIWSLPIGGRMGYLQDKPVRTMEIDLEVNDVVAAAN